MKNTLGSASCRRIGNATSAIDRYPSSKVISSARLGQFPRENVVETDDLVVARHPSHMSLEDIRRRGRGEPVRQRRGIVGDVVVEHGVEARARHHSGESGHCDIRLTRQSSDAPRLRTVLVGRS
jgi:hypothetical protein